MDLPRPARTAFPWSRTLLLPAAVLLLFPGTVVAATLCGTVRDAGTASPIPAALVLAYHTDGAWSGASATTDPTGGFCLSPILPGTYDLQVRVRDHLVGTRQGIVVEDDVVGVTVDGVLPVLFLSVFPNPTRSTARIAFHAAEGTGRIELAVHDLRGRLIRGWSADGALAAGHEFTWDLRDRQGRRLPAGVYLLRLTTETDTIVRRVVHLP